MQNAEAKHPAVLVAVIAILVAGFIHIAITPIHFEHASMHGIFFLAAGVFEIMWAYSFWMESTHQNYLIGLAIAGGLILLWALTRLFGAPFIGGLEPVDAFAIACKASEGIGLIALIILAVNGVAIGRPSQRLPRVLGEAVGLGLVISLTTYGLARASEPLIPDFGLTLASSDTGLPPATVGDLTISGAWVRPPVLDDGNASAYMVIRNRGSQPDTLLSICAPIAEICELNQTVTQDNSSEMRLIESLDIPAYGGVVLKTGSYHGMLKTLDHIPQPGDIITLSVTFRQAGTVQVFALVRDVGYDDSHLH
jgi:copper(I)-binding protein